MGIVERISPKVIKGWVDHRNGGRTVTILVNGVVVASTEACHPIPYNGEFLDFGFSRAMSGLWTFLGPEDVVEIHHDGRPLPLVGHGSQYRFTTENAGNFLELRNKVSEGWIFDKKGRLTLPLARQPRLGRLFAGLEQLQAVVRKLSGYELFPTYGTLLGCIRDGNFIPHDNDVDLSYISTEATPEGVRAEYIRICAALVDQGYDGIVKPHGFAVKNPVIVDIFPSYFDEAGNYQISFGHHGDEVPRSEEFFQLEERKIGIYTVRVPKNSEKILSQIYGEGWRIPDPGFSHYTKRRKYDERYRPEEHDLVGLYWRQFYSKNNIVEPSTFAHFVADQLPENCVLLDIGCGTGRDTVFLATRAGSVIGMDAANEGLERGRTLAESHGLNNCEFAYADVNDSASLANVLSSRTIKDALQDRRKIVLYCRFFMHAITETAEATLFEALNAKIGAYTLFAEYRTDEDKDLRKEMPAHFRRYLNPKAFADRLFTKYGLEVTYNKAEFGLSIFKGEDPHLCRVIAKRQGK